MDEQILKTLENIKTLLSNAMAGSGGRLPSSADKAEQAKNAGAIRAGTRVFTAIALTAKNTNDALLGLNKSLVSLNTSVGRTTTGFGSLASEMAKFKGTLTAAKGGATPTSGGTGSGLIDSLMGVLRGAATRLKGLGLNGAAAAATPRAASNAPTEEAARILQARMRRRAGADSAIRPVPTRLDSTTTAFGTTVDKMLGRFTGLGAVAGGVVTVFSGLIDITTKLTADYLTLARLGLGSAGNLADLSFFAARAGMSLKEYTEMVRENSSTAARQGSLNEYDKLISAADGQLATIGVFGAEARTFQAALASTGTEFGILNSDLGSAVDAQIKTFSDLRASTLLTTDEFAKVVDGLGKNEQVQREMLGLAPAQRQARMQELIQIRTLGNRLGLTGEAATALGNALIAARGATVTERLDQRAAILNLGALTGDTGNAQRITELGLKGTAITGAESQELVARKGEFSKKINALYAEAANNGNLGMQHAIEDLRAKIDATKLGQVGKASDAAALAADSGPATANADFGKSVGSFGRAVGKLTAWTEGIQKSIVPAIGAAVGGVLLTLFRGPIVKLMGSLLTGGGIKGAAGALATGAQGASGAAGATGALAKVAQGTGSVLSTLLNPLAAIKSGASGLYTSLTGIPRAVQSSISGVQAINSSNGALAAIRSVFAGTAGALTGGIGTIIGGLKVAAKAFGPIAGIIDGIKEAITGEMAIALNPSGGFFNRVGGVVTAFLTAIPNFLIDVFGYVFGSGAGGWLQNKFDVFVAGANAMVKHFFGGLFSGLGSVLGLFLSNDSQLVKDLKGGGEAFEKSSTENMNAMGMLWDDSSKTLKKMGKSAQQAAAESEKATTEATTKATAAQVKFSSAQAGALSASTLIGDAQAIMGQPQVQIPKAVVPATVNTIEPPPVAAKEVPAVGTPTNTDMMIVLTSMLQVMRDNLAVETRNADATDAMLLAMRPAVRFADSEQFTNQLLRRG